MSGGARHVKLKWCLPRWPSDATRAHRMGEIAVGASTTRAEFAGRRGATHVSSLGKRARGVLAHCLEQKGRTRDRRRGGR